MRNPKAFQQVNQLIKSNGNPQEMITNMLGKYKPEQINQFKQYANSFGISNEQLEKYGINAK